MHGCQMAIARFLDRMCLALWDSGLWLRYAALQNLIPSSTWIAPPRPPTWRNPRKGRDQILPSGNLGGYRIIFFQFQGRGDCEQPLGGGLPGPGQGDQARGLAPPGRRRPRRAAVRGRRHRRHQLRRAGARVHHLPGTRFIAVRFFYRDKASFCNYFCLKYTGSH